MAANKENAKTGNLDELHPDSEHDAMDLPSEEHSCKMPIEHAPESFDNWVKKQWFTDKLKECRIYGPVLVLHHVEVWEGEKVHIKL